MRSYLCPVSRLTFYPTRNAVYGRKRGRKVGSGLGKRKADDQLSQNMWTKKSRTRIDRMTEEERLVHNADNADRSAVSKKKAKFKKTAAYAAMSAEEQKVALQKIQEDVMQKR